MAKKSAVNRNEKRARLIEQHKERRAELKATAYNQDIPYEERELAQKKLNKLPRDSSRSRYRNRCQFTGRPRGVFKKFMLSRIRFREMAHQGLLPGVTKASW